MSGHVRLLYRSIARWPDLHSSDRDILVAALRFNPSAGLTGYLWRGDGQFFQALHGPAAAIETLLGRIRRDGRHRAVEILLDEPAPAQSPFGDWSMGYDHFLEAEIGLRLDADGRRPALGRGEAAGIFEAMVGAWREAREFGSAFPLARMPGEAEARYLSRIADGA